MGRRFWYQYFGAFTVIYFVVFGLLGFIKSKNINNHLNDLINGPNENVTLSSDPCKHYVGGNPTEPDKKNINLLFVCKDGKEARNTLGWAGIQEKTVGGVIREVANVNRIDLKVLESWNCDVDGKKVENWNEKVINDSLIKCKYEIN